MSTVSGSPDAEALNEDPNLPRVRPDVNALLDELRARIDDDWAKAQDAIGTLVRLQIAHGLAAQFIKRTKPYEENAALMGMLRERLLDKNAFLQKPPFLLQFYTRLLFAMESEPTSILEIGVKGGGSTTFWKALFPRATVVGMDIRLDRALAASPPHDGVIYVQGDQSDVPTLTRVAGEHGPFSIVIDDGSHMSEHQAITMRCLLRHVRPGGFYVVEDIHANLKKAGDAHKADYGADIWPDFVVTWFERFRSGPTTSDTDGGRLALDAARVTDDLIIGKRVIALRVSTRYA